MRPLRRYVSQTASDLPQGAVAIAAGLAILAAAMLWPDVPSVTGLALVILGATSATVLRFRGTAAMSPIMLVHLATYGSLYALFLGASLHAAAQSETGLGIFGILDLALSICPLGIALECVWCELHTSRISE